MTDQTASTTAFYDAIDAFQRTHRLPGLQHAQLRGLLAEHLARSFPAAAGVAPAADQTKPVKQRADCTELEWAEQERARFERLYTREYTRADQAEELLRIAHETSNRSEVERARAVQRAEAMERAMQSTAADALKHSGCHMKLMAQCLRAERAEAAIERVRAVLESEAVVGRSALDYRGLITSALMADETQQPPAAAPAVDRAAVLREAATVAEAENSACNSTGPCQQCSARTSVAIKLRRLADETPTTEAQS